MNKIENLQNMQLTAILIIVTLIIYLGVRFHDEITFKRKLNSAYENDKDRLDYHEKYLDVLTKACMNDKAKAKKLVRQELIKNRNLSVKEATIEAIQKLERI